MSSKLNRRAFARNVAATAAGAVPLAAAAQQPEKRPPPPPTPGELSTQIVAMQYPEGLEPEHLVEIRAEIERQRARSRLLSLVPLTNADEPAPMFAAWRAES